MSIRSTDLDFAAILVNPSSALDFGTQSGAGDDDVKIIINGLVKVTATGSIKATKPVAGFLINAVADITPIASGTATYDPNVFRGAIHDVNGSMQQSKKISADSSSYFEPSNFLPSDNRSTFQQSKLLHSALLVGFEPSIKLNSSNNLRWEDAKLITHSQSMLFESLALIGVSKSALYESGSTVSETSTMLYEAMNKVQTSRDCLVENSVLIAQSRTVRNNTAYIAVLDIRVMHETAKIAPWYYREPPPVVVPTDPEKDFPSSTILDFTCLWYKQKAWLNFGATCQPQDKPKPQYNQGVIFVTNSVSLTRSDDGREIKMLGFSVGIDSNSYAWSFSATVPLSELLKVDTALEQRIGVDFECNGNLWRFILDSCDDSIAFGESSLTIKGKSRAMLLAHPYAKQRGFKYGTFMSARQIAEDELNRNGVPSGFTLDWDLVGVNSWNVPANTYSYTGKTPINSLQWIAEAAGGFINADMSADILHVLAHYPVPSWEWSAQTPSINLPMSLITSRSRGRINKPAYNGVMLYGENDNGIGALVKRTGTSGGYQPPMVTSDLMTDTAAAISRGKMILSDTGDIGNIGISMPLVADIGVLKPSTLIGVNDGEQWVGMVRGTTITGRLSSNRALEIDQSIDVERHFDKELI